MGFSYGARAAGAEPPPYPPKTLSPCIPTLETGTEKIEPFAAGAAT